MKTELLREGLAFIKPALKKTVFPICQHVRIQAEKGELVLTGCNLEVGLEWRAPADLPKLDLCVQGAILASIAETAGEEIEFKAGKRLGVSSSSGRYHLPILSGADMPVIKPEGEPVSSGDFSAIREEIQFCVFAAGKKVFDRPFLNGVGLQARGGDVAVSASDTLLIASSTTTVDARDFEGIIPTGSCDVATDERLTRFEMYPGVLVLKGESRVATIKLLEGKYPHDFIPRICVGAREPAGTFKVSRDQLLRAIAAVSLVSESSDGCEVRVNGKLTVSAKGDGGDATHEIECEGAKVVCGLRIDQFAAVVKRATDEAEFMWAEGFPDKGGAPLLTKNGDRIIGAVPYRL